MKRKQLIQPDKTGANSPCINVCQMSEESELCKGCDRTLDEITKWSRASDSQKRAIWVLIKQRRAAG